MTSQRECDLQMVKQNALQFRPLIRSVVTDQIVPTFFLSISLSLSLFLSLSLPDPVFFLFGEVFDRVASHLNPQSSWWKNQGGAHGVESRQAVRKAKRVWVGSTLFFPSWWWQISVGAG